MAGIAARTWALAAELFARSRKVRYEGIAIASRTPRMMMTTRSSMRVKPLSSPASRCRILLVIFEVLLPWGRNRWPSWHRRPSWHRLRHPDRVTLDRVTINCLLSQEEGRGLPRPSKNQPADLDYVQAPVAKSPARHSFSQPAPS